MEDQLPGHEHLDLSPEGLLALAAASGLSVFARGDRLVVRGPRGTSQELVRSILGRKEELWPLLALAGADDRDRFEERAAIAEYDGGVTRSEAEQVARAEIYPAVGVVGPQRYPHAAGDQGPPPRTA
jgi:hypothetical protein